MKEKFQKLARLYKSELLENVIPFWLEHSLDKENGGYFTCLERDGTVFDTDKFVWLQGREVWMFAFLYNHVEKKQAWLDAAILGAEFLKKHGHDGEYNFYFSLDRAGTPQIEPYNIFSNTFACMAFGQLSLATGNQEYAEIAKKTFDRVIARYDNPKGRWCKAAPAARQMKAFALPMIVCNLALEIEPLIEPAFLKEAIEKSIHLVMDEFYRPEVHGGLIVEYLDTNGELVDNMDGRLLNPGHMIESTWFMMDLGERLDRPELIEKAVKIALNALEFGWDKKFGGIFYFMDRLGRPLQQLEHDQKLWWVHIETLIALLKGYRLTGNPQCWEWFERVHAYTWAHFKDEQFPEWFGYLNRQGEPILSLKGGKWKGCFHVPRGLYQCWKQLEILSKT